MIWERISCSLCSPEIYSGHYPGICCFKVPHMRIFIYDSIFTEKNQAVKYSYIFNFTVVAFFLPESRFHSSSFHLRFRSDIFSHRRTFQYNIRRKIRILLKRGATRKKCVYLYPVRWRKFCPDKEKLPR